MKMTRRVLALLLALCLTFGNVMPAMATGLEGEEVAVTEETITVVPEVEETEAPAEAEEPEAPAEVEETEAPVEETEAPVVETEAPVEETVAQIVDEAANATSSVTISFASTAQRTVFTTSQQVWEQNGITVTNNKASSTSNVADYSNPARFYKSSELIIAYPGMTKIEFTANSSSYATALKDSITTGTVTSSGSVVTWDLGGAVDSAKIATLSAQVRMNSLTVYADDSTGGEVCNHSWDNGVVTAPTCTADGYTTYTCSLCGDTKTGDVVAAGHKYDNDKVCTVCGDGTVLTIPEAIKLGGAQGTSSYTAAKYCVTGKITEVYQTTYGNMYISDDEGNTLTVYGTWNATGSTRYDKLDPQPVAGDTIKVYGIVGNYNGTPQIKDGWILEHIPASAEPEVTEPEVTEPEVTEPEVTEPEVTEPTPSEPSDSEIKTGVAYKFGMIQENVSATDIYYIDGQPNGYYMNTTTDFASAANVYVEVADSGYYLYTDVNGSKQYINMVVSGTHVNGAYEATASTVYTYDADKDTLIAVVNGEDYWFGTRNDKTYTTVGPVKVSYAGFYCKLYEASSEPTEPEVTEPTEPEATEPGDEETISATLSFADLANRTEATTSKQVWTQNGVTMTNTGSVNPDYSNPVRLYKNSVIKVEFPGMTKVVFNCNDYSATPAYTEALSSVVPASMGTVTVDGLAVTLVLAEAANSIELTLSAGQVRLHSIEVFGTGSAVEDDFVRPETPEQIVAAAYALAAGETLRDGPYTLTGKVVSIDDPYDAGYNNITVTMAVAGCENQPIKCFRIKGTGADTLKVGDIITVTGALMNYNGTIEFGSGSSLDEISVDTVLDSEEELIAALAAGGTVTLGGNVKLTKTVTVPAGVTVTLDMAGYTIEGVVARNEATGLEMGPAPLIQNNGTLTITGNGTFTNTTANCVSTAADTTLTIENGVFTVLGLGSHCVAMGDRSTLTILGGTFTPVADSEFSSAIYAGVENPTITISGGTFASNCLNVGDGVEAGAMGEVVTITGGTFADDVTMYVAEGYIQNEDGAVVRVPDATLDFTDVANRASITVDSAAGEQVWQQNGITLTNNGGRVADYKDPVRLYASTTIKVEYPGMTKIVFDAEYSTYVTPLVADLTALNIGTVSQDGIIVTLELNRPMDSIEWVASKQERLNTITVYADKTWGTENNPIEVAFTMNDSFTQGEATVMVPANTTRYFQAWGIGGMELSVNGGAANLLSGNPRMPVVFTVENTNQVNAEFKLAISYPVGSSMNPAELTLGENVAEIAQASNGYYYTWTADFAGTLFLEVSADAGWTYTVNNLTTGKYGDSQWSDSEDVVNPAEVEVSKGDEIQVIVNTYDPTAWEAPKGIVTVDVSFKFAPGHETNPVDLTSDLLYEEDFSATVTVPAGETYHYIAYRVGGMIMTINDGEGVLCTTEGMMVPYAWTITNDGETDAEYVITLAYPVGDMMNPEVLYGQGETSTYVAQGDQDGYFYTFTVESAGTLEFAVTSDVNAAIIVDNNGKQLSSLFDAVDGVLYVEVAEGDVLSINVAPIAGLGEYPEATITWTMYYPVGSELNPIDLTSDLLYDGDFSATVTVPAGKTYNFVAYRVNEMLMTINGGEAVECVTSGMWTPYAWTITNDGEADAEYYIEVAYPTGHQMNPDSLWVYVEGESWDEAEGLNVAELEEGKAGGYQYSWYAPKSGLLTIDVSNGRAGWAYSITNLNTYAQTELHYSYDVPTVNAETIEVSAGDEIVIMVNTCGETYSDVSPAGEVHFFASFAPYVGTEENPALVEWVWNDEQTEATATVTIPANTAPYFVGIVTGPWAPEMLLEINGELYGTVAGSNWQPYAIDMSNEGAEDAVYELKLMYPVGNRSNPAELVMGENTTTVSAASWEGFNYAWTAPEQGTLTITPTGENWAYSVSVKAWSEMWQGFEYYYYGENHISSDGIVAEEIAVNAGDIVEVNVGLLDTSNGDADVTIIAAYEMAVGIEANPIPVQFDVNDEYVPVGATVTIPANTTYYYQTYGIGGMMMDVYMLINDAEAGEIYGEYVDNFMLPGGNPRMPVVFALTNETDSEQTYDLHVYWPDGSQMAPQHLYWWSGSTSVKLEAGDTDGYYYAHTSEIDGTVKFYLDEAFSFSSGEEIAADIIVTNLNTYEQKVLSVDGVDGVMYMDISRGDELQIIVTAQPDENWNYPDAFINWGYSYIEGTENNPAWMELGKNSVKIEANDEDGYYLIGYVEDPSYVTFTMTSSNWEYQVGVRGEPVYDEQGYWQGFEMIWTDVQASNNKGAKSTTVFVDGGNYFLRLNTANKKAGTVNFTATDVSKAVDIAAGLSTTLTFTDPKTGKAVAASNVNWEVLRWDYDEELGEEVLVPAGSEYATVSSSGKLTAAVVEQETNLIVYASLKSDETVNNVFYVYIRPAVSSIQINKGHIEETYVEDEWIEEEGHPDGGYWEYGGYEYDWVTDEENVSELTVAANGEGVQLNAIITPDAALSDVTWTSSNTKVLDVYESSYYDGVSEHEYVYLEPVYNQKTGKFATGTVTLTATANDGSGVKATVKVNVVMETRSVHVYPKNYQWYVVPGKSATMVAELDTWYNQAPTNKNLKWEIAEFYVMDYDFGGWDPYVPAEGETPVATISDKGVLKVASTADRIYEVVIKATAEDTGVFGTTSLYITPLAKTGEIRLSTELDGVYDLNIVEEAEEIQIWANYFDKNGNYAATDYKLTSSNKRVAEIVRVEEYDEENEYWYSYDVLQFTGKTGKVTLTAVAADGSKTKATMTINVVKGANAIEMVEEAFVGAGKTLTLKATPAVYDYETESYSYDVSDKNVLWSAKVVEWDEDMWEWVEVEQDIGLKISNGKLSTNAKKITGTDPITVMVTATAKQANGYGFNAEATCLVTIYPATQKVTLERNGQPVSGTLTIDDDFYIVLDALGAPAGEYTWKTSNPKVAVVEDNLDGSVTVRPVEGGKLGSATITATAADGSNKSAKVTVKVVKKVDELVLADKVGVAAGKSVNLNNSLTISPANATNKKVNWSWATDADKAMAAELKVTLNASGTLSASKLKTVSEPITLNVKVTALDGFKAVTETAVTIYPATTKVELVDEYGDVIPKTGNTASYRLGEWQMTAVGTAAVEGAEVLNAYKWTSSNTKIATVDQTGLVTFTGKVGSVTIKATALDGTNKYAQTTIKVIKPVDEVYKNVDHSLSVAKGKTVTMSKYVTIAPADATTKTLNWTMELVSYNEETGEYVTKGDGIVPKTMATLNAKTGALKCVNVSDWEYVRVTFTAADNFGATGSMIVVLAPDAIKGIEIYAVAGEFDWDKLESTSKMTTDKDQVILFNAVTNDVDDIIGPGTAWTVSNNAFDVFWEDVDTSFVDEVTGETVEEVRYLPVVRAVDPENAYGTVKVTIASVDGGNKKDTITITFVEPEPAA